MVEGCCQLLGMMVHLEPEDCLQFRPHPLDLEIILYYKILPYLSILPLILIILKLSSLLLKQVEVLVLYLILNRLLLFTLIYFEVNLVYMKSPLSNAIFSVFKENLDLNYLVLDLLSQSNYSPYYLTP